MKTKFEVIRSIVAIRSIAGLMVIAIIAIALIGCKGDGTTTVTFTVSFNANGGIPTPQNQTVEKGKTATEPTGVTKANNTLNGWYKEEALTNQWNFATDTVTADITLYAKWEELPHDHTATITGLFDNNASATVKGNLTDTELNGVADKIKTALNDRFASRIDDVKDVWRTVINGGVTIIVEASPDDYTNWKTIVSSKTIYLSLAATDAENLGTLLGSALSSISNGADTVAKAINNRNTPLT